MNTNKQNNDDQELPGMLGYTRDGCVEVGGQEILVADHEELKTEYEKGMAVMPTALVMFDTEHKGIDSPPAAEKFFALEREGRLPFFQRAFFLFPSDDGLGNAHEVAESLLVDLMMAEEAEGWTWVMGDVLRSKTGKWNRHSWLEYQGWAVDGACGKVRIWPAWYYRKAFQVRNVHERNPYQVRSDWRKDGHEELVDALKEATTPQRVRVYDFVTKQLTEMPVEELGPNMVKGVVKGIDGIVWIDPTQVATNKQYFHPPFPKETRRTLKKIAATLRKVDPKPITEWEDGFRRDYHAEAEIFLFECIADAFTRMTAGRNLTPVQKQEYYRAIITATRFDQRAFAHFTQVQRISKQEAIRARDMFYRVMEERGGREKYEQLLSIEPQSTEALQNN